MRRCFILSNTILLKQSHIDSLNIQPTDCFLLFNHMNPLKYLTKYPDNLKIVLIRWNKNTYWGLNEVIQHQDKLQRIVFVNGNPKNLNLNLKSGIQIDKIPTTVPKYPLNKTPTTGFIGLFYTIKHNPDIVPILVGFTGENSKHPGKKGSISHDYTYEQLFYKLNKINSLFNTNKKLINFK